MVHVLKRMRVGNSKLRGHYGEGSNPVCANCVQSVVETNEHYLTECTKFNIERNEMMRKIRNITNREPDVPLLMGFYDMKFIKNISEKQKEQIVQCVLDYIKKTKRFED